TGPSGHFGLSPPTWSFPMRATFLGIGALAALGAFALVPGHADAKTLSRLGSPVAACHACTGQVQIPTAPITPRWHKFAPRGAGYRIAFPSAPEVQEVTSQTNGFVFRGRAAAVEGEDGVVFQLNEMQFPFPLNLDDAEEFLDAFQAGSFGGGGIA